MTEGLFVFKIYIPSVFVKVKTMYKKTLKHQNRNAKLIMWLLFVCGVFLFLFAGNGKLPYPAVAQSAAIVMICAAIFIATEYILKEYTIEVCLPDNAGVDVTLKPDLIIYEQKGKKRVKVCHISLSDIKILEKITPKNKEIYKQHSKGAQKYKYNTAFLQADFIHILTHDNISLLVTYDESLFLELQKYV